jgi:hypothetical protein
MNKLLLTLLITGLGAITSGRLSQWTSRSRAAATQDGARCREIISQAQALAASAAELRNQVKLKRAELNNAAAALTPRTELPARGRSGKVPPKPRPQDIPRLRQELGIGWHNSPDYVLVSKAALKQMHLLGVDRKGAFSPTACAILGFTASERDTIEAAIKRVEAQYYDWVKTAVQRVQPAGEVVADYRLPANPLMAAGLQTQGMTFLGETVGMERAELIVDCSVSWQFEHGDLGQHPIRFTVRRHPEGQQPPLWSLIQAEGGGSQTISVSTGSFPELFRTVFPGGWRELAQREGFALPEGVE